MNFFSTSSIASTESFYTFQESIKGTKILVDSCCNVFNATLSKTIPLSNIPFQHISSKDNNCDPPYKNTSYPQFKHFLGGLRSLHSVTSLPEQIKIIL